MTCNPSMPPLSSCSILVLCSVDLCRTADGCNQCTVHPIRHKKELA